MDTNVLLPVNLRVVLLDGAFAGLYQVCWSEETLDQELRRNLMKPRIGLSSEQAERSISALMDGFPHATILVDPETQSKMQNDPKDRHVTAAAVHAQAKAIVTSNLKDFKWSPPGVRVLHPDEFLCDLFETYTERMFEVIRDRVDRFQRPSIELSKFVCKLRKPAPNFADLMLAEMEKRSLD